ncbi:flavocytochrome c [Tatumella ptyseos]|uniref:flavocytochrome c n=1 Tax=Tatumella ptyseos TaxID=82987 RepID=UPI0026ED03FA|nr:flavocytochrome c [Tatumella ptyseos]WKX26144.1 flavocytochrome c [Tatumella ptyseos]
MDLNNVLNTALCFPKGQTVKNRLFMAPMTTCSGFFDGSVPQDLVEYYGKRAQGLGAVIVECCFIEPLGPAFPGALGIDSDKKIPGLARIARAIRQQGALAILQIYHGGRMVEPELIGGKTPVAPSAVAAAREGATIPRELSSQEIDVLITKFGDAVNRAIKAGFDGVEIHGANTYLIQQFFSPHSNRRQDQWGGDREKRSRFPLAVLDIAHQMADRAEANDFIIGYRFSPEEMEKPGITFEDSLYLLEKLAQRGLDYVHFSVGHWSRSSIIDLTDQTPLITRYRQAISVTSSLAKVPVIGVGGIVNRSDVDQALAAGYDLLAVGKACIVYPDWWQRLHSGETLTLEMESTQREALFIPEPLWHFSLVDAMIRDVQNVGKKFKAGIYHEKVEAEALKLIIDVQLDTDRITDIRLQPDSSLDVDFTQTFEQLRSRMLVANSPYVDAIAGATTQSEALKKAVSRALSTSTKHWAEDSGVDPASLEHYDVIVIGSGGAGLAAAINAHDLGAKVVVVERMPTIGGNTLKASVGMNAAQTRYQRDKGIQDTKACFYEETLKGGKFKNNPDLLQQFVERAPDAIDWLAKQEIVLSDITITGGMSIDRTHRPADRSAVGGFLISGLVKNLTQRHIEVLLDTKADNIEFHQGKVSGVRVVDEYGESRILQTKAVIVATGGFSANTKMVEHYRPELTGFVTTNHKGATGSGITLLQNLGAATVDMAEIQIHPTVEQKSAYLISESIRGGGAILVSQAGARFCNEMETRDKVSAQIIGLAEKSAWIIFDEQVRSQNKAAEEYLAKGFVIQGDSVDDLATQIGMDPSVLTQTLETFNQGVRQQQDPLFGRTTALRHPLDKGPFYAIKIAPGVHHTMGGIAISTQAQVLDTHNHPLAGIWAAGEVVGGIHGANRIGGNAVADIIIFGLLAGEQAANWVKTV